MNIYKALTQLFSFLPWSAHTMHKIALSAFNVRHYTATYHRLKKFLFILTWEQNLISNYTSNFAPGFKMFFL